MAARERPFVFLELSAGVGRVVVELFTDVVPKTCENFRCLCTGERGRSATTGLGLWYGGAAMHRIVPGLMAQGGDISDDGSGGESIYGETFDDENFALRHDREGPRAARNIHVAAAASPRPVRGLSARRNFGDVRFSRRPPVHGQQRPQHELLAVLHHFCGGAAPGRKARRLRQTRRRLARHKTLRAARDAVRTPQTTRDHRRLRRRDEARVHAAAPKSKKISFLPSPPRNIRVVAAAPPRPPPRRPPRNNVRAPVFGERRRHRYSNRDFNRPGRAAPPPRRRSRSRSRERGQGYRHPDAREECYRHPDADHLGSGYALRPADADARGRGAAAFLKPASADPKKRCEVCKRKVKMCVC